MCHLEHYDSWKMTQHSRMLQDAKMNQDAIVVPIDEKRIREDLAKLEGKLKVPSDKIYVPDIEEILYTIGSQWKQRYLVKKDDTYYISPDPVQRGHRSLGQLPRTGLGQTALAAEMRRVPRHRCRPGKEHLRGAGSQLRGLPRQRLLACGPAQNRRL